MLKGLKEDMVFFVPALVVLALDQLTKLWIRANLSLGQSMPEAGPIRLTHVANKGAVFGLFPNSYFPLAVTLLVVALLILSYRQPRLWPLRWGMGIVLGGGMGNLIDRLRQGYVTDFVDLRVWPVFNVADAAIVMGSGLLIFLILKKRTIL